MVSLTVVNIYCCANALLIAAVILLSALKWASRRMRHPIAYRHLLWIGYGLTIAALLLPLVRLSAPRDVMPYTLQVWSAPSMHSGDTGLADHRVAMPLGPADASISLSLAESAAVVLFAAGLLTLLIRVALDAFAVVRIVLGAQTLRRLRGVKLLVSDRVRVPFSVWIPGVRIVVIPTTLLLRLRELQMAIRHEMQHHRQHDTKWLYLYPLLKASFFWNPAAHMLTRLVQELQEFACDAAVVARHGISAKTYCRSLVWVAEQSMGSAPMQLSASMNGNSSRKLLKRRVDALLARPTHCLRSAWVLSMSAIAMMLMNTVATVSAATIQDRRISLDDAMRMAATTPAGGISIPANEAVVAQLNRLLGTPDGREYVRASLNRMREHKAMMAMKIVENDLPIDLLAVPLVESGYRNLEQSNNPRVGAGLWMFVTPTARRFHLTVNVHQDDRLDPAVETGAALRLFTAQYSRYRDWGLALLAYNCGNGCVDKGVEETGARDVWRIVAKGYENDPDYVARTMAAMLILRNPSALN
jgi:beta-lactamase regulating signal transducer with metallopeptidase domain